MNIFEWWPLVDAETRGWLIEHNGEPLPPHVIAHIMAVTGGTTDSEWWAGESADGPQLPDEAVRVVVQASNRVSGGTLPESPSSSSSATWCSFLFRWLEARVRMAKASSWLQRFWAMMAPQARSIVDRLVMAALRSSARSCPVPIRTARRNASPAILAKSSAMAMDAGVKAPAAGANRSDDVWFVHLHDEVACEVE